MRAEQLTDVVTFHGEGPVWSDSWGGLRLVDLFAGDVLTLADDGTVTRRHVDSIAAALRPRVGGGAVIATERGFTLEAADGTLTARSPSVTRTGSPSTATMVSGWRSTAAVLCTTTAPRAVSNRSSRWMPGT